MSNLMEGLSVGKRVVSEEGHVGTITEIWDAHNVIVEHDDKGRGMYCQVEGCEEFDPVKLIPDEASNRYETARKIYMEYTIASRKNKGKHFPSFFVWLMERITDA